ncbi:hypothetical protein N0V82_008991 [Gnomoniopsis sp. IMI 355080]|nr:hypothetical protein N0V82_008991 [Gnomoniopsis sp. IMI 355080]
MAEASSNFFSSIKGSIKGRLSRSASNASNKSANDGTRGVNPFSSPAPSGPAAWANTQYTAQEAPPAYQAAPPVYVPRAPSPTPSRFSAITATTPEDQYAFLSSFDTIFLIDDSGSMVGRSWREVQSALSSITPICTQHDADGVDIYFLNHRSANPAVPAHGKAAGGFTNVASAATVDHIFTTVRPGGMTPTGTRLNHILKAYLRHYEEGIRRAGGDPDATDVKPINVIMVTDGVPSDDPESVLLSVAQKLDKLEAPPHQVGVQFFQVGNESGAAEALRVLDDELSGLGGGVRDMVDTVTFNAKAASGLSSSGTMPVLSAEGILKTVLGAVVKRLDRARIMEEERRSMRSGLLQP